MNAPNPTAGERDFDALRRAQRAHEPSMEEILASIRAIIADDREPAAPSPAPQPKPAPSRAADRLLQATRFARRRAERHAGARAEPTPPAPKSSSVAQPPAEGRLARPSGAEPDARSRGEPMKTPPLLSEPGRRGRFGRFSRRFRPALRCRARELAENPDARNPASDAQDLARRASSEPRRAAGARGNPARRARGPLSARLAKPSPGRGARAARPHVDFRARAGIKRARPSRFRADLRFRVGAAATSHSSTRRAAVAARSAPAASGRPR